MRYDPFFGLNFNGQNLSFARRQRNNILLRIMCNVFFLRYRSSLFCVIDDIRVFVMVLFLFQLSELEKRVLEAETRAVEAEGKVSYNIMCVCASQNEFKSF